MKLNRVLKEIFLLTLLLLGPVSGVIFCAVELVDRHDFERIEREFYLYDELHALQLRVIITSYEEQTLEQIGHLHQTYMQDGSFALFNEVEQMQSERIEKLIRLCPMDYGPQLAACVRRYELRVRASYLAEIPFPFRCIQRGMADYMLRTNSK